MSHDLSLQEQFLLLCLNDVTGKLEENWVDYGLNGAALAELMLRERIRLDEKGRVIVTNAAPTGDDLLDRALSRLAQSRRIGKLSGWVATLYRGRPGARQSLIDRLIDRGILTMEEGRILWVFPTTRYPARDPISEHEVRERLRRAILADGPVDQTLTTLIALLNACHSLDRVLSKEELKRRRSRIKQICEGDAVGTAVSRAVSAAVAAAEAAVIVASTAGATGG